MKIKILFILFCFNLISSSLYSAEQHVEADPLAFLGADDDDDDDWMPGGDRPPIQRQVALDVHGANHQGHHHIMEAALAIAAAGNQEAAVENQEAAAGNEDIFHALQAIDDLILEPAEADLGDQDLADPEEMDINQQEAIVQEADPKESRPLRET